MANMSDMIRLTKMTELLYFKGNINNKSIDIKLADNKEITELNNLVSMYLNYAERQVKLRHIYL